MTPIGFPSWNYDVYEPPCQAGCCVSGGGGGGSSPIDTCDDLTYGNYGTWAEESCDGHTACYSSDNLTSSGQCPSLIEGSNDIELDKSNNHYLCNLGAHCKNCRASKVGTID